MSLFVWWFLAPEGDAAAVRSVATTKARQREEWPHVALPGVDGPDMNTLEKLARPKRPKGSSKIGGVMLDRGKMTDEPFTVVSRVSPELVAVLAGLDEAGAADLCRAWAAAIDGVAGDAAAKLVARMADFARRSATDELPVLELVVM